MLSSKGETIVTQFSPHRGEKSVTIISPEFKTRTICQGNGRS